MRTLRAGALVLEPQRAAHAAEMFGVLSDPAIYEFENAPPPSQAWLEQRYAKLETRRSADGREQWLNWVVRLPSGELAGYVQATVTPGSRAVVAYEFASRHWRQGIGSGAVRAMMAELIETYAVTTFIAVLKARNHRSLALLHKLGFTPEVPPSQSPADIDPDELALYRPATRSEPAG